MARSPGFDMIEQRLTHTLLPMLIYAPVSNTQSTSVLSSTSADIFLACCYDAK